MRLWSIHPKYLDTKGLVALWREALLAQKVLQGNTKGYKNHPQLIRFKATNNPEGAIATYLRGVEKEAAARNYTFDKSKISKKRLMTPVKVTSGQIDYELTHLKKKLRVRDTDKYKTLGSATKIALHPLFKKVKGDVESWEIV
jgi:hypothetical protein